jgi:hypothetical protein
MENDTSKKKEIRKEIEKGVFSNIFAVFEINCHDVNVKKLKIKTLPFYH